MNFGEALPSDFRALLQNELVARCKKNRSYSLRAFARALDVESSSLSKILNGKRKITDASLSKLGERIGLVPEVLDGYRSSLSASAPGHEQQLKFQQMGMDAFRVLSDWYHFAILELMHTISFEPNAKWVARALGLTVSEVNIAIGNLSRLGFIEITADGKWIDKAGNNSIAGNYDIEAAQRKLQRQILEKAIEALEESPSEDRDNTAVTVAIQTRRLPEARKRITRFRREMAAFFERDSKRDQVYHLAVAFYPVTKFRKGKETKP